MRPAAVVLVLLVLFDGSNASSEPLSDAKLTEIRRTVENSKLQVPPSGGSPAAGWARKAFDSSLLSAKDVRLVFAVTLDTEGEPEIKLVTSNGNEADRFYCEQTIWETCLFSDLRQPEGFTLFEFDNNNSFARFSEITDSLTPGKFSIHLIPAYIQRFDSSKYDPLFRSPSNVVHISISKVNDPALAAFRKEWSQFFRKSKPLNAESLTAEAARLREKYKALFEE